MEWISVKERLPEEEGSYICTVVAPWVSGGKEKTIRIVSELEWGKTAPNHNGEEYAFNGYGFGSRWSDGIDNLCEVVAWMELPEAYEGE